MDMQAKLLRVLEDHTFYRVGGTSQIRVDVQVISASNKDLKNMIKENEFRQDLFYRMNVVELYLPPLRERKRRYSEPRWAFYQRIESQTWQ